MQENKNLVQNCLDIFQTQGLRVTMDDIAQELSMSKRTLYEKFENKEELVLQCIELLFTEEREKTRLDLSRNANIIEELFPILNYDIYNRVRMLRDFFGSVKKQYPEVFSKVVASHLDEIRFNIGEVIAKGIKQGFFREDINIEIIQTYFFDLQASAKQNNELFERFPVEEIFRNTLICFVRGISTVKGVELIENVLSRDYPYYKSKHFCE